MCSGLPSSRSSATKCGQSRGWQSWLSLIQLHMAPITSCKYWKRCFFFLFLTWLNFGSSLNTLPRVIIRTGFVQFLSPIDFCFLLQLSLTHSNYNLGNWQELIWLHFVKSQNSWTTSIQFNNNCSSFSINIIGNNNYCSSKVQQHWQNCRFQKSEFCILQKYWHVEIFTLSSLL